MASSDDFGMEIENDSFLDCNGQGGQSMNRLNSQNTKKISSTNQHTIQEPEPIQFNNNNVSYNTATFRKLTERNYKGDMEIKMTIQLPSHHPVLPSVWELIQAKSGCMLNSFNDPGVPNEVSIGDI